MIKCKVLPNGNLKITAGNATREWIKEATKHNVGYWSIMDGMFEDYSCNGSFQHFDAGQANPFVGLTDAPSIAEAMDYSDEEGKREVIGRVWYFADSMMRDDLEDLKNKGFVIYQLVPEVK